MNRDPGRTQGAGTARAVSVHEALSVPVRARLLDLLEERGPRDAHQLAADLQLHVTTVRFHLDVLAAAGL